uniref:RING-type domain-containing protein n=1 Tax=Chromera velia CCMP2878 TaxID=1169474 RepID=A0A0G4HUB8_9ALVE|eukprot:Cvel_31766.t1-p1 / transcript=Cvel_31766.t1 / gene=Cvel_31766 / organism=Chromera_velia_CCMP2878 / gene_product=hypothetical protein / transcript_product=hypothetical protein / location=Cvel_scaffold4793:7012-7695(-) / protein_length=228 / sequence_SO=supercontig / SO=protein_coding / is_pseudo=false
MELLLCALPGCLHCFHRRCIESELCAVAACPSCSLPVRVVAEQLRLHRMREMQETVSPPCASASGGGALKRAGGYSQPSTCRRVQDVEARNEDREERGEAVSEIASEDARWSSAFSICSTEMSSMAVTSSRGAKGASARESKDFVSGVCGHVQGVGQEGRRGREQESTTDGQWNHLLGADRSQGVHLLYESGQTAATGSYGQRLEESLAGNSGGRVGLLTSSLTGTSA